MIKKIKIFLVLLIVVSIVVIGTIAYAQPKIPKENIPSNIPNDVKTQIEELYSQDPVKRAYGAYYLGNMASKATSAIPFLVEMLDDSVSVKWDFSDKDAFPSWKEKNTTEPSWEAQKALIKIGKPAVESLIEALHRKEYRCLAISALGDIKDIRAINPLLDILKIDDGSYFYILRLAVISIGKSASDVTTEALIAFIEHSDKNNRVAIISIMDDMDVKDPRLENLLIAALKDKDKRVRAVAAKFLAKFKNSRVVDALFVSLKDKDASVREQAVFTLRYIVDSTDPRIINALIEASKDKNHNVRSAAMMVIGDREEWKYPHCIDMFLNVLKYDDTIAAESGLDEIGEMAKKGDARAIKTLISTFNDKTRYYKFRAKIGDIFGEIKNPDVVHSLIVGLEDKTQFVRVASARALGKIGDYRAVKSLMIALNDEEGYVRNLSARALKNMKDAPEVQSLINAFKEENLIKIAKYYGLFITLGEEGTRNILIKILDRHGTKIMAEDFLNSGEPLLEKAAREWAECHNYKISQKTYGNGGASWGRSDLDL